MLVLLLSRPKGKGSNVGLLCGNPGDKVEIPLKEIPSALIFGIFLKVHNATDLDGWLSFDPQIVLNG